MKKILFLSLIALSTTVSANSQAPLRDVFVTDAPSFTTLQFVVKDGEYQICKTRPDAKTFVMNDTCLWEVPIAQADLLHPHSVAGVKVEKAETLSINAFFKQEMNGFGANFLRASQQDDKLVIYYSLEQNELVAR